MNKNTSVLTPAGILYPDMVMSSGITRTTPGVEGYSLHQNNETCINVYSLHQNNETYVNVYSRHQNIETCVRFEFPLKVQ